MSEILVEPKVTIVFFRDKTTDQLEQLFKLQKVRKSPILEKWISNLLSLAEPDRSFSENLSLLAEDRIAYWNEDELKFNLIYPLMLRVNFKSPHYTVFAERPIQAIMEEDILLTGRVDLVVASGKYNPQKPYFFFHEYKKERGTADDPIAQLLSAMLVGQQLNNDGLPVYGSYVIGRMWFFVTLKEREYCISNAYISSKQDDLEQVFMILTAMKGIIEQRLSIVS